jgi:hypothetical protein
MTGTIARVCRADRRFWRSCRRQRLDLPRVGERRHAWESGPVRYPQLGGPGDGVALTAQSGGTAACRIDRGGALKRKPSYSWPAIVRCRPVGVIPPWRRSHRRPGQSKSRIRSLVSGADARRSWCGVGVAAHGSPGASEVLVPSAGGWQRARSGANLREPPRCETSRSRAIVHAWIMRNTWTRSGH